MHVATTLPRLGSNSHRRGRPSCGRASGGRDSAGGEHLRSDANARVDGLSTQVTRLSAELTSANAKLAALDGPQATVDPRRVTTLATQVRQIKDCLPEVQTEIFGLTVDPSGYVLTNQ